MNEIPVVFGADRHLVGTLTLPDGGATRPIGLLLVNAGVIHRIGPHRLNVKLARRAAAQGYAALRIDLSGLGDSHNPQSSVPFGRQAVLDLRAAMDHLHRATGLSRFALAGFCSGAHHGLAAALEEPRLVGLWMLDGWTYPTPRTARVRLAAQLAARPGATLAGWALKPARLLLGAARRSVRQVLGQGDDALADGSHPAPSQAEFAAMMQRLCDRGVRMRVVYTGGRFWFFNHAEQWRDAFAGHAFVQTVPCDFLPEADHTVTSIAAQRTVIELVGAWLDEVCAAAPAGRAVTRLASAPAADAPHSPAPGVS